MDLTLQTGYPWVIYPETAAARECEPRQYADEETGLVESAPPVYYGYHGTDQDPCNGTAEYLCDYSPSPARQGYVVLTAGPDAPEVPEGWACERYEVGTLPAEVGRDDVQQVVAMQECFHRAEEPARYHFAVLS